MHAIRNGPRRLWPRRRMRWCWTPPTYRLTRRWRRFLRGGRSAHPWLAP
jgi:Cytidylate kinase